MNKVSGFDKIIMGVDPGTSITGYGIIGIKGNSLELITYGVINMTKLKGGHPDKLKKIFERCLSLIDEFNPDEVALESPFYAKNIQVMLKLGRAQGVAMAAALYRNVPIWEYAPRKIKQSITGKGMASKEQVAKMLETLLHFKHEDKLLDGTDGLAAAVCHFFQKGNSDQAGSNYSGWKAFVSANPKRTKK